MTKQNPVKSLDDMLQADRKKRKAETLAQEIFGKNRRQSTPQSGRTTPTAGASLASRMGISKQQRSTSTSSITRQKAASRPSPNTALARSATAHRLETALTDNVTTSQAFKRKAAPNGKAVSIANDEISIRGAAGPYTVIAQNFAPGTTAADIESVMQPIGGELASCKLAASNPTVIAEIVFLDKVGAENVVSTFNNKRADGRVLFVYMKEGGGSSIKSTLEQAPAAEPEPAAEVAMEVEDQVQDDLVYQEERLREDDARARRDERPYDRGYGRDGRDRDTYARDGTGRAEPMYQDGRYGFNNSNSNRWDYSRGNEWSGRGRMFSENGGRRTGYRGGRW